MAYFVINRITPGCSPMKTYAGIVFVHPPKGLREAVKEAEKIFWKRYSEAFEAIRCEDSHGIAKAREREREKTDFEHTMSLPTFTGKEIPPKRQRRRDGG